MNLISLIEAAFCRRTRPPSVVRDNAPKTVEYADALAFSGKTWQQVTCAELEKYSDAIYGFSPQAFCYFLPGIYVAGITENRPDLLVNAALIHMLDRGNAPSTWDEFFVARWPMLEQAECQASQQWLLWLADDPTPAWSANALTRAFDTLDLLSKKDIAIPIASHIPKPRQ